MKAVEQTSQDTDAYKLEYVYFASNKGERNFTIDVEINGKQVEMMIDTGCARTLVPKQWFKENINCPIRQSTAKLTAFGVSIRKGLESFDVKLRCKNLKKVELP